jgi:antimicrobial peptide resistance and lipid A acylation protein PagP
MFRSAAHAALLVGSVLIARPLFAEGDWGIVINGRSVHLNATKNWNEDNWGLGFEKEFNSSGRWVTTAVANGFKDSMDNASYMAGASIKRRFRVPSNHVYFDAGLVGFMMTRHDVRHDAPFPGVLPTVTFGARHFAVNVTYMPGSVVDYVTHAKLLDPAITGVLFIQLKLPVGSLGPRHAAVAQADSQNN